MSTLTTTVVAAFAILATLAASPATFAQDAHTMIPGDAVQWGAGPPILPKGSQIAVLHGDPGKEGPFVIRLRFPSGAVAAPHWHPTAELVTILQGTLFIGMGETIDRAKAQRLDAGGFAALPAKLPHYAWADGETVIEVHGVGPFTLNFVNPKDDPTKASQ